jgi:hypothetical protein
MDVKDLFAILADYLNFVIDFLGLRGMEKYRRLGIINKELVSFFVAGVLLAYSIALMKKIPSYQMKIQWPVDLYPGKKGDSDLKTQTAEIGGFVMMFILGAVLFHCVLFLYHKVFSNSGIGTMKDTVNAVLAVGAVFNPINALFNQIRGWAARLFWASERGNR